jgi:hypothetical protein
MDKLQKDLAVLFIAFGIALMTMLVMAILIITVVAL